MTKDFIKKLYLVIAIILFIACLPLPIGYYTFTRLVVFIISIFLIYYSFKNNLGNTTQIIIFALIGILFNPILPIYLNNKFYWMIIDFGIGIYFIKKYFNN
ncbi:hypothetical protein OBK27_13250 [Empedobacter falsenii]